MECQHSNSGVFIAIAFCSVYPFYHPRSRQQHCGCCIVPTMYVLHLLTYSRNQHMSRYLLEKGKIFNMWDNFCTHCSILRDFPAFKSLSKTRGSFGVVWGRFGVVVGSFCVSCNNVGNLNFSALSLRFSVILCRS